MNVLLPLKIGLEKTGRMSILDNLMVLSSCFWIDHGECFVFWQGWLHRKLLVESNGASIPQQKRYIDCICFEVTLSCIFSLFIYVITPEFQGKP